MYILYKEILLWYIIVHWLVVIKTTNESIFPFNGPDSLFKFNMTHTMIILVYIAVAVSCKTVCLHQHKVYEGYQKTLEYFDLKDRDRQLKWFSFWHTWWCTGIEFRSEHLVAGGFHDFPQTIQPNSEFDLHMRPRLMQPTYFKIHSLLIISACEEA